MPVPKTPVSILQEMMVKKQIIPNYELVHDGGGTHDNTFMYKVSCDGCSATGWGRCKKDAKHMAAKKLLEAFAARNNFPQLPATPVESPVHSPLLDDDNMASESSPDKPFMNAIGALQDLCTDNDLDSPAYTQISDVGPPHARVFTIQCTVSTFIEEGKARTKKQAKHEAAQKMLDRLSGVVKDNLKDTSLNPYEPCTMNDRMKANETVQNRYMEVSKVFMKRSNLGVKLDEYHLRLKKNFTEEKQKEIVDKLQELKDASFRSNEYTEEFVNELLSQFQEFLEGLSIGLQMFASLSKTCDYISVIQVISGPDTVEMGLGKTKAEADLFALREVISTIEIFLS